MKQWMITHSCHGLFGFGISSVTSFYPQKCTVQRRPCQRFVAWENCTKLAAWQLKDSFSVSAAKKGFSTLSLGISLGFLQFYPQCLDTSRLVWPYGMAAYECCPLISSIEGKYKTIIQSSKYTSLMGLKKKKTVPIFQGRPSFHPVVCHPAQRFAPFEDRSDASHGPHPRRQQLQRHPIEPSTDGRVTDRRGRPTHWKQVKKPY